MLKFKSLLLLLSIGLQVMAQQTFSPKKVYVFDAVPVQKPILLDSTNLNNAKFSDEMLLSYDISFPSEDRFTTELTPDKDGYFLLQKPVHGYAFNLISFFVSGNQYGKGKLKVTSPNRLQVYLNNEKKATKSQENDSIQHAGTAEYNLDGMVNNARVLIKLLASASDKVQPAVMIEFQPDKSDSTLVYSFDNVDKRDITIVDILDGKRVNSSEISPSGRFVLLKLTETLPGGDRKQYTEIYDQKQKRTIFSETSNRSQLGWMPASDVLYYVAESGNGNTMYTLDPVKNETKIIAERLPKETFYIAPDEKSMFYSTKETRNVSNPAGLKRLLSPEDRQANYRNTYYMYRYFFDTGLEQQLTFGQKTASLNDVSQDGKKILFTVSEEDLLERPFSKSSMYLLDLNTMKIDTVWENEGFASSAQFSPDGRQLLISASAEAFNGIGLNIKPGQIANSYDSQSYIMDLATKHIEPVTRNFDPSIDSQLWSVNDNLVYYRVQDGDRENIYRYNTKTKKFEKLPLKEDVIRSFNVAKDGEWASYTGVSQSNSNRSYLLNIKNLQSTLISDPYADKLNKLTLGQVKDWSFKSSFGDEIQGRYYLPPNFDPNKKYPLIVYYYGGTSPTQRVFESTYPLHVYAAQGFVVYTLNPSGTTGYGQEFAARHVNAWGKQTSDEIIEGVKKFVAAHAFVDGTKIRNIGASYGGFMTMYLITKTDMFAASVSHAGISNITSYWGEGYWGYTYSSCASAGSYPWNNKELYVEQSPLFHADKIKTPLLLLQGTADTNVPLGESIQMYTALKLLGKPVEYIQVEGENHAIYDYDKRIQWNYAIYAWFTKWLKGDSRWWDSMFPDK